MSTGRDLLYVLCATVELNVCGCEFAVAQPGQTPAQVQACSTDATLHNVAVYGAGVLAAAGAAEGAVAATESQPSTEHALAVSGIVTAAVAGGATLAAELLGASYTSQGCAPALPPAAPARKAAKARIAPESLSACKLCELTSQAGQGDVDACGACLAPRE
jgi:hypothetical protein